VNGGLADNPFPLTPPLSLGEREYEGQRSLRNEVHGANTDVKRHNLSMDRRRNIQIPMASEAFERNLFIIALSTNRRGG